MICGSFCGRQYSKLGGHSSLFLWLVTSSNTFDGPRPHSAQMGPISIFFAPLCTLNVLRRELVFGGNQSTYFQGKKEDFSRNISFGQIFGGVQKLVFRASFSLVL